MIIDITSKKILTPYHDLLIEDKDKRVGLLKYDKMPKDHGIVIDDCQQIHSRGMKFNFQAIYLDKMNKVIALNKSFKPGLTGKYRPKSTTVIEVPIGTIEKANVQLGDMILWVDWGKMTKKAERNKSAQNDKIEHIGGTYD